MLHPDFKNGEQLDLHYALALFVMGMGFLFYIDAAPGTHALVAQLTVLAGLFWLAGHYLWKHWKLPH